ncbi:hypothetical protein BH11ACT3_BH11ACT3_26450 [soil metagenome]
MSLQGRFDARKANKPEASPFTWLVRAARVSMADLRRAKQVDRARAAGRLGEAEIEKLVLSAATLNRKHVGRVSLTVRLRGRDPYRTDLMVIVPTDFIDDYKPGRTLLVAQPDADSDAVVLVD